MGGLEQFVGKAQSEFVQQEDIEGTFENSKENPVSTQVDGCSCERRMNGHKCIRRISGSALIVKSNAVRISGYCLGLSRKGAR